MDWRRGICSPRGDVTRGDVTRGDVTRGDVTRGDVTRGDVTRGDVTRGDVTRGDHGNWEHFIRTCTDHANNTWGGTGTGADRTRTGRGPRDKNIKGTDVGRTRARPLLHLKCHILKTHTFAHVRPTFGAEARACGSGMCPSCGGGGGSAGCEPVRNAVPGTI
eukprot:gene24412-biopygen23895